MVTDLRSPRYGGTPFSESAMPEAFKDLQALDVDKLTKADRRQNHTIADLEVLYI